MYFSSAEQLWGGETYKEIANLKQNSSRQNSERGLLKNGAS